ncbi:hypothetical protein A9Q81_07690 [Gammaproteobacteria bacterium 42_54_T18]|nr:hypothetical protein A9Q81_07690 [Gammaproteobacteria bacterium 42_54_T18]
MDALVDVKDTHTSSDFHADQALWCNYFCNHSANTQDLLIQNYMNLATTLSLLFYSRYAGYGVSLDDLSQNARVGLIEAVQRYNPHKNVKFETFASFRIRGELKNGLKHYCHDIEIYREHYSIEKIDSLLPDNKGRHLNNEQSLDDWSDSIANITISILLGQGDSGSVDPVGTPYAMEEGVLSNQLWGMVSKMDKINEEVILYHYLYEYSFEEISKVVGISKSAVFKRHRSAINKLRRMQNDGDVTLVV